MNRTTRLALVVALPLVCMSFAWGQEAPSSAPWLGDQPYSIQFEGKLRDALIAVERLTGRRVIYRTPGPQEGTTAPVDMDRLIRLQFEQATLDQILLSLCEQAGLVYDAMGDMRNIFLRRGNPQRDPRPVEVVDQYVLRVSYVTISLTTGLNLRWGESVPGEATMTDRLTIRLDLEARSPEAFARVAGVEPVLKGTTDTGLVLVTEQSMVRQWPDVIPSFPRSGFLGTGTNALLPAPPEGPRMLTTLEGKLKLYSEVKMTEVRIEPDSAGKTITHDDVTVTVREWRQAGNMLTLNLQEKHPLPPRDPQQRTPQFSDLHWAVAVGKDGRETPAQQPIQPARPDRDGAYRLNFSFAAGDVDYVRLTVARRGPPDLEVPFVIRNIPLP